jgi:hypothetical protein
MIRIGQDLRLGQQLVCGGKFNISFEISQEITKKKKTCLITNVDTCFFMTTFFFITGIHYTRVYGCNSSGAPNDVLLKAMEMAYKVCSLKKITLRGIFLKIVNFLFRLKWM